MNRNLRCGVVITLLTAVLGASGKLSVAEQPADLPPPSAAATQLLDEGDAAAAEKDYKLAVRKYQAAYEQIVPAMRGLALKQNVHASLLARDEVRRERLQHLREDVSDQDARLYEITLVTFGFCDREIDIRRTLGDLHADGVAGYYNTKSKDLVLVHDGDASPRSFGVLGSLFSSGEEFDVQSQKVTMAHELTHALQDQHFDLSALQDAASDDDMRLALRALIEGDATLLCLLEADRLTGGKRNVVSWSGSRMESTMSGGESLFAGWFERLPPQVIRLSRVFPYRKGAALALRLYQDGGFLAVDQAFLDPPVSTEQLLHPYKYTTYNRDVPLRIDSYKVRKAAGPEWKHLGGNTLGEFKIRILLADVARPAEGPERDVRHYQIVAASGWDGDRYEVFERTTGDGTDSPAPKNFDQSKQLDVGLVWVTTWDEEADAAEFAAAFDEQQRRRLEAVVGDIPPDCPTDYSKRLASLTAPIKRRRQFDEKVYLIEQRGKDVAVVEGFPAVQAEALLEAAFNCEKTPKVFSFREPIDAPAPRR